ncbi:type VII secretion system-associated protein [Streptomyces albus subsp. chlorinus]|uniref:type VII secretion system-associated protein n=1 Tax=Streptomyces albus TaxID=1888 RepID=UPI001570ECC8|nr:type VII secretion system-associated protein [Streptomyces albus]NSC24349.1 type VII secretion system-associated protein [Streptomyces albus subsp. chlorinus]
MAEGNQPPTQLNKEWIQNFKDHDLAGFRDRLKEIAEDGPGDPTVPAMKTLSNKDAPIRELPVGTPVPLAIGNLAQDAMTHGDKVNSAVVDMVKTLDGIISSHLELFEDIDSALAETIKTLFDTQGQSLDAIDGQKLYDIFEDEDVEADLTASPDEESGKDDD